MSYSQTDNKIFRNVVAVFDVVSLTVMYRFRIREKSLYRNIRVPFLMITGRHNKAE